MIIDRTYSKLLKSLRLPVRSGLVVAFSGGADSSLLLYAAEKVASITGGRVVAFTAVSPSVPQEDLAHARGFADSIGAEHIERNTNEFSNENYLKNDLNRCYYCKSALFEAISVFATGSGYEMVAYGYNESDRSDFRPGHRAAREHGVIWPLADACVDADLLRKWLLKKGFEKVGRKLPSPCLSSRIFTGVRVTSARLKKIESMESFLKSRGLSPVRARLHSKSAGAENDDWFRIETSQKHLQKLSGLHAEICRYAESLGVNRVEIDQSGYKRGGANRMTGAGVL